MPWTAKDELGELSGQVIAEPELTRQAVMLTQLRYRDDRDRPPESATPLLYVVEGPRARAIGMEFDLEVVCDQLDVAALVHGRQVRKDGRESPDRFTAAAPVLRCGERSDRGGVEPAAQRHGIVAREAACHRLREQLFEPVSDIGGGEPGRLEQLGRVPISSSGGVRQAVGGERRGLWQSRHSL